MGQIRCLGRQCIHMAATKINPFFSKMKDQEEGKKNGFVNF